MLHLNSRLNLKVLGLLRIESSHSYYSVLMLVLFYIAAFGVLLSVVLFFTVAFSDDLFSLPICFGNECFKSFFDRISVVLQVGQAFVGLLALIGTVGALLVALLSYLATDKTAKFTNYISHLTLFQSYFISEVGKLDTLSISSFDVHRMYGVIFSDSKDGVMSVSDGYRGFISELNSEINKSNLMAQQAIGGSFRYLEHQARMRAVFGRVGFNLPLQPKNDFYEIETQLLLLIDSISASFCGAPELELLKRVYR